MQKLWAQIAPLLLFLSACGDTPQSTPAPESTTKSGEETGNKANTTDNASGSSNTQSAAQATTDPKAFFFDSLLPAFNASCASCHTASQSSSVVTGPLTLFSYTAMVRLMDHKDPLQTTLYLKASGAIEHGGQNQCQGAAGEEVCKKIALWQGAVLAAGLVKERTGASDPNNPNSNGTSGTGGQNANLYDGHGRVTAMTLVGKIQGFVADPNNPSESVEVAIFVGGDKDSGTEVYRQIANLAGYDNDLPGNHRFEYTLAENYRDGRAKQVYVYSVVGNEMHLINPDQLEYYGYAYSTAGRNFYEANVQPLLLQGCQGGCHTGSMNYETNFAWMLWPRPHEGGSRSNNIHINNPATANGESHGGGRRCNNINSGVCAQLQQWYDIEFGSL